ncbi:MMPL family transporter [Quadrisphaera sp. DSM 44207]|uniref:MMPL family transporter n=1 Tax=Quadrisphaera sp. DSM 44207 TaxID=1881057 RepID=UPI00087F13F9|nr:MMPL family transporter [Quadrisphaera sp. DSM 44207]SDQ42026.1 putative drug exporter of the RND superfamily [Quadrisphaera sp. DSM 44207]
MSSLLYALGRAAHRRWGVVLVCAVLVIGLAAGAAAVLSRGTDDAFAVPGTESQEALDRLEQTFPAASGTSAQVVVVAQDGDVSAPQVTGAVAEVVAQLEGIDQVAAVASPLAEDGSLSPDAEVSDDGDATIVSVQLNAPDASAATQERLLEIAEDATGEDVRVTAGGAAFPAAAPGLTPTEGLGLLVALVVLGLAFGSLLAAGMPLLTAVVGVALTTCAIFAATAVVDVSATAPLLAVMIGLAVGIDYALFILARHRAQLAAGLDPEESTGRAVATAGSAVVFAGLTVMIALAGLGVAGIPFLTVMGLAAAVAVLVAVLVDLTLLPALFGLLGRRLVPRPRAPRRRRRPGTAGRRGAADRWVSGVLRAPLAVTAVVVAGLALAAVPALDLRLALPGADAGQRGTPARDTYDLVSEEFGPGYNGRLLVTGDVVASTDPLGLVEAVAEELRALDGVASVPLATPNEDADTMVVQVVPEGGPTSVQTQRLVEEIRALAPAIEREHGVAVSVTGQTAVGIDISARLMGALAPFGVLVVGLSLVLLAMVFRSVWVPVTAAVGFVLSIGAALGSVVAVYQWGWLEGPLHTVATGPVISFMPIILMAVLFGLAMDYEVFLVSGMREQWVRTRDARAAVRRGFTSAAKVVTAAALIMFAVFAAFVPEGDATLQPIALGLAVGVFVDAFVVRMTLVPAVMALLGQRAWWLPRWLERALPSFDVEGEGLGSQIALRDWPHPGAAPGVHAQDLALDLGGEPLLAGLDLTVEPGRVLLATSGTRTSRTALAMVLAARTAPTSGRLKVAGAVLPQQAWSARRSVALVRCVEEGGEEDDVAAAVRRAVRPGTRVLVLDGLDSVPTAAARQAALDAVGAACAGRGVAAVVTATEEAVTGLRLDALDAALLDLSSRAPRTAPLEEARSWHA